ncbi:unnamed protein product [Symbiodinium sp. KB8]|nr:unnamed protein product [Symbiodinium sp. KB8]
MEPDGRPRLAHRDHREQSSLRAKPKPRRRVLRSIAIGIAASVTCASWFACQLALCSRPGLLAPFSAQVRRRRLNDEPSRLRRLVASALLPGKYRSLTKIRLRKEPDTNSEPTGESLSAGEVFEATEALSPSDDDIGYLKVAGGWVFDQGIAGRWRGKAIVEAIQVTTEPDPVPLPRDAALSPDDVTTSSSAKVPEIMAEEPKAAAPAAAPAVALGTARVEMVRLPDEVLGAGFEFVRFEVAKGRQPLTFMLGSGFPTNALTERGRGLIDVEGAKFTGGWLSEAQAANKVSLQDVRFLETGSTIADLGECSTLDFPQAQLAEQLGIEVHGILGKPFFTQYDVDIDRYRARADIYTPGDAASQGFYSGVKHLPGIELPQNQLGLAVKGAAMSEEGDLPVTPSSFIGLLDSSAAHTVLNWEAAKLFGFSGPSDVRLTSAAKVLAASADGQAEEMPVTRVRLSLCSVPEGVGPKMMSVSKEEWEAKGGNGWFFADLSGGDECVDFGAIDVAIGNPLGLSVLEDSKIGPFKGAAAIIGQDVLFQADRVVMNMKDSQIWLQPGEIKVKHRIPLVSSCRHRIAKAVYEAAPTAALKRLPPEPKGSQHKDAETFFIDLAHLFGDPEHALEKLRKVSPLDRATYTRVAVFGFAILHLPTLSDMLKELPDVQELVLPDLKLDETSRLHLKHFALESQLSHSTKITFLDRVEVSVWQLFGISTDFYQIESDPYENFHSGGSLRGNLELVLVAMEPMFCTLVAQCREEDGRLGITRTLDADMFDSLVQKLAQNLIKYGPKRVRYTTLSALPRRALEALLDILVARNALNDNVLPYSLTRQTQKLGLEGAAQLRRCVLSTIGRSCPNLCVLDVRTCQQVDNKIVRDVLQHCERLEVLRLDGCPRISDSAFAPSLWKPPLAGLLGLRELSVGKCGQITAEGLMGYVFKGAPYLRPGRLLAVLLYPGIHEREKMGLSTQALEPDRGTVALRPALPYPARNLRPVWKGRFWRFDMCVSIVLKN